MSNTSRPETTPAMLADGLRATRHYADLMFAFGFARLREEVAATQLRDEGVRQLDSITTNCEFHRLARTAFECRIDEALRGEPHAGTLDDRCPEVIAALLIVDSATSPNSERGLTAYQLGRLLDAAILEPDRTFNSYHRMSPSERLGEAWLTRQCDETKWLQFVETAESPQAIWDTLQTPHEANDPRMTGIHSSEGRHHYCQQLTRLIFAARQLPFPVVRRFLSVVLSDLPAVANGFTTAPYFSRLHFGVVDALVLALVATGPPPPEVERPGRLELLRSIRPKVLAWIDAVP